MLRSIIVKTVSEEIVLVAPDSYRIDEVLRSKRLYPSLFQGYTRDTSGIKPIPLRTLIRDIPHDTEILARCIRNTDFRHVLPQKTFRNSNKDSVVSISDFNLGKDKCTENVQDLDPESAKELVRNKIVEFLSLHNKSKKIVVGISGGGDSNTLAQGLRRFTETYNTDKDFICYTIIFESIWPGSASERATTLCKEYGLSHQSLEATDVEKLCGINPGGLQELYEQYRKKYGEDTNHFLGTYLISLVGRKLCEQHGAKEYILGFNREDLLADLIFSLMNGQKPLSFPIRNFGDIELLMPLWDIPKILLDACYPKYSLTNYDERAEDESTYQRSIIYYLAHGIEDVYPNLGLSLMKGAQKIFSDNWANLNSEKEFDLFTSEYADKEKIEDMKNFLKNYFHKS